MSCQDEIIKAYFRHAEALREIDQQVNVATTALSSAYGIYRAQEEAARTINVATTALSSAYAIYTAQEDAARTINAVSSGSVAAWRFDVRSRSQLDISKSYGAVARSLQLQRQFLDAGHGDVAEEDTEEQQDQLKHDPVVVEVEPPYMTRPKVALPPGYWMGRIASLMFFFSPNTVDRVFGAHVADYRHEMIEAEAKGKPTKWLRVQYWTGFAISVVLELANSTLGKLVRMLIKG